MWTILRYFHFVVAMLAAGASLFVVSPVQAQWVVIDPANLAQNSVTAVKQVFQEIASIQAQIARLQQLQQLVKSTASLNPSSLLTLTGINTDIANLNKMLATSNQVAGALGSSQTWLSTTMGTYGASGQSWTAFLSDYAKRSAQGDVRAQALFSQQQSVTSTLTDVSARRQQLLNQSGQSVGATQAVQANTGMLDIVVSQQQQLNAQMAAQLREQATKLAIDQAAAQNVNAAQQARASYNQGGNAAFSSAVSQPLLAPTSP